MTVLDQDDVDQEDEDDLQLDQEDDVEHDRQVRSLEERLRRLSIVGEPEFIVAGNLDEGYSVDIPESGGEEGTGTGACCTTGTCSIETEEDCTGFYLGDNTTCDGIDCAVGACCTDGVCTITTEADCLGTYEGDGTDCDPNPCPPPPPTGACCVDTACTIETESHCVDMGGTYQGNDTDCDPNPCPQTGACCHDTSCDIETEADCTGSGGTYQGDGTDCDPNPCTSGTGACCFDDGICNIETAADCASGGGTYRGDGSSCTPNPCRSCCGGFLHDGHYFYTKTVNLIGHTTCGTPDPDCNATENITSTGTYDPDTCELTISCSGDGDCDTCGVTHEGWVPSAFAGVCGFDAITNDPVYMLRCFGFSSGGCDGGAGGLIDATSNCMQTIDTHPFGGGCVATWTITVAYSDQCNVP